MDSGHVFLGLGLMVGAGVELTKRAVGLSETRDPARSLVGRYAFELTGRLWMLRATVSNGASRVWCTAVYVSYYRRIRGHFGFVEPCQCRENRRYALPCSRRRFEARTGNF